MKEQDELVEGNTYYVSDAPELYWGKSNKDEFEFVTNYKGHPYFAPIGKDMCAMCTWKYWKSVPEKKFVEWGRGTMPKLPFFIRRLYNERILEILGATSEGLYHRSHTVYPYRKLLDDYEWSDNGTWQPCGVIQ